MLTAIVCYMMDRGKANFDLLVLAVVCDVIMAVPLGFAVLMAFIVWMMYK